MVNNLLIAISHDKYLTNRVFLVRNVSYKNLFFFSAWIYYHKIAQKNKVCSLVCGPLSEVKGIYSCIKKPMLHSK